MSARDEATKLMADLADELGLDLTAQQRDLGIYLIESEITKNCGTTHEQQAKGMAQRWRAKRESVMPRGRKPQNRCKRGHLMTPGNRRIKLYIAADGSSRWISAGCRRCNAELTLGRNLERKLAGAMV